MRLPLWTHRWLHRRRHQLGSSVILEPAMGLLGDAAFMLLWPDHLPRLPHRKPRPPTSS